MFIKGKADEDLDTTQSYSKQDKAIIETICVSVSTNQNYSIYLVNL